jgi:hypothetical protein
MIKKMFELIIFSVTVHTFAIHATIINIPDDYPTIQQGIDVSTDGDTVLVQPGTYVENINFNGHNIVLGSLFLTTEDTIYIAETVIDADSSGTAVAFENGENEDAMIIGFTIRRGISFQMGGGISCVNSSPVIASNFIHGNTAMGSHLLDGTGGGIYCNNSSATIDQNVIAENLAVGTFWTNGYGGGIYCYGSDATISNNIIYANDVLGEWGSGGGLSILASNPTITNNVIAANSAFHFGGGVYCFEASPIMVNNTISANRALNASGGGIYCELVSNPIITNSIFWADSAYYGAEIDFDDSSSPYFTYCDIQGGWNGEGNIDIDPLFRDPESGDYHLMADSCGDVYNSPCIDAGDPAINDIMLGCDWGLGELRSDMGAYGGGDSATVAIDNFLDRLPSRFALLQNYPNPFNASTTIRYSLPERSDVRIDIYNILGQRVATLFEGIMQSGYHAVTWQADGFPSGIYFARLQTSRHSENIRMLLLK